MWFRFVYKMTLFFVCLRFAYLSNLKKPTVTDTRNNRMNPGGYVMKTTKLTLLPIILLFILFMPVARFAQQIPVIQNPAKPAKADAGRVLALKEVMRISDEAGDFYFKRPYQIKIAADSSIFLIDEDRLLKFDSSGKYLFNFQKNGEGPGEFVRLTNYFLSKNTVIVYARQPAKIIMFDLAGKFLSERKLKQRMAFQRPLIYDNGNFWSLQGKSLNIAKLKTGYFTSHMTLCLEYPDKETKKTSLVFNGTSYMVRQLLKGDRIQIWVDSIIPVMTAEDRENTCIYVTNTQPYIIQKVSLENEKIVTTFNRQYKSISYVKPVEEEGTKTLDQPTPDFFNDVIRMYFHNNQLWVFTSTIDQGKGVLIDIYSPDGTLVDQFYLPLSQIKSPHDIERLALALNKHYLYVIEKDEDDTPYVVKYQYQL